MKAQDILDAVNAVPNAAWPYPPLAASNVLFAFAEDVTKDAVSCYVRQDGTRNMVAFDAWLGTQEGIPEWIHAHVVPFAGHERFLVIVSLGGPVQVSDHKPFVNFGRDTNREAVLR